MITELLLIIGLIVWLLPALVLIVGSQLAPIQDEERIRSPREVLAVLFWPVLVAISLFRR